MKSLGKLLIHVCQNATVRMCGAWIRMYYVLCSKTYSKLGGLFWTPAGSQPVARGARICESRLLFVFVFQILWQTTRACLNWPTSLLNPHQRAAGAPVRSLVPLVELQINQRAAQKDLIVELQEINKGAAQKELITLGVGEDLQDQKGQACLV